MTATIDEQSRNWGVSVVETDKARWAVESVTCVEHHTMNIYYMVCDQDGKGQSGIRCVHYWPEGELVQKTDVNGETNFTMGIAGAIHVDKATGKGKDGPYEAFVESRSKSDVVKGMGIPVGLRDVEFRIKFKPKQKQTLEDVAIAEAQWRLDSASGEQIPINTDAWLYKYAGKKKLGKPRTGEFPFEFAGKSYRGQVYEGGIVYAELGQWDAGHSRVIASPWE